jgi:predicted PurR-regulated permease PerM
MGLRIRRDRSADATARPDLGDDVTPAMRIAGAWAWRILAVAAVLALVIFLVVQLRLIVVPLLVAMLLAALLVPFRSWLQRHNWPKWAAVALSEVGVLAVIAGLIWLIIFTTLRSYKGLVDQTVVKWAEFKDWLLASPLQISEADINTWAANLLAGFQKDSSGLVSGVLSIGATAGHVFAGTLIVLFATLFILIDGRGIWQWIVRLFPVRARPAIVGAGEAGWITLSVFVRVQVLVAFIDAVGIGLGAWILGLFYGGFPLLIPIIIVVFLASFIPVVGAVLSGALAAFVALVYLGPVPAIIMVGIVVLVQQVEGHVLQPFLVGNAVKVHPLAVVIAVAAGGFLAGIPGALFAVPIVAVANVMIGYIARGEWRTTPHPTVADVLPPTRGIRRAR